MDAESKTTAPLTVFYGQVGRSLESADVATLPEASTVVRRFIDSLGLGSSGFRGGWVRDAAGRHVATVGYNGRLWTPAGEPLPSR